MMQAYTLENFPVSPGGCKVQHEGKKYQVSVLFDGDTRHEDYGFVVRAGHYRDKHPGELLLKRDLFFDFSACCKLAREEGWGYSGYDPEKSEETHRQVAARAAREVFEDLKAWYHDEWCYVGVIVQDAQGAYLDSMCGIESTDTEYIREVVRGIIQEAEEGRALQGKHQNFLIDSRGV